MTRLLSLQLGPLNGLGPLGNTTSAASTCTKWITDPTTHPPTISCASWSNSSVLQFVDVISKIIGVLTVAGAIWFIFQLFTGAIGWISAGSDKQALDNAKKRLTNAVIGLLIVIISYALIAAVGMFLGIDIINLEGLITNTAIK